MRIGLFTDSYAPEINGVNTATETLFNVLRAHGHEVFVVTTNPFSKKVIYEDNILRLPGIVMKKLYDYRLANFLNYKANKIIKNLHLDIIHVQTELSVGILGRVFSKTHNIPLVYTYHTLYEDYTYYVTKGHLHFDNFAKRTVSTLSRLLAESCTEFTTTSNKTKDILRGYGVDRYINVIPNGLDIDAYSSVESSDEDFMNFRREHHFENKKIILSLGRVAAEKSINLLIDGYDEYLKTHCPDDSVFLIVGDGPGRAELEKQVKSLKREDNIIFLGKVPHDQVPFYYHVADLFVSASISETQGLTFMESMASKTLVLARFDQNLVDVIEDTETGFFFEDVMEFTNKLDLVLNLPEEKKAAILDKAFISNQKFSLDTYYERMLEVYSRAERKNW